MNRADTVVLLPFILLAAAAVVVMLAIAFSGNPKLVLGLTLAGLAAAFASLFMAASQAPRAITPLLMIDRYAIFYSGLITAATFVVALVAYGYLEKREGKSEEFYLLLLLATVGSAVLVSSLNFDRAIVRRTA